MILARESGGNLNIASCDLVMFCYVSVLAWRKHLRVFFFLPLTWQSFMFPFTEEAYESFLN